MPYPDVYKRQANSLISKNVHRIKKELLSTLPDSGPVFFHHAESAEQEAEWIAAKIAELEQQGVPYQDITILYRAHYVTRTLEEVFRRRKPVSYTHLV